MRWPSPRSRCRCRSSIGDLHGLNTGEHQPMKLAAMEAHWRERPPGDGVPLVLFAVPNE
jgi:cytochrome d ubiquinol oxidase subunit I